MSPLRVFLGIGAAGVALSIGVAASLHAGVLQSSQRAAGKVERQTPSLQVRAELPRVGLGAAGWSWAGGVPGFAARAEERFWDGFELPASLRTRLSAAARAEQLPPGKVRILRALRISSSRRDLTLASAPAADGAICLAATGDHLPATFHCMRKGSSAANASALVAVATGRPDPSAGTGWTLHLLGVARGDVQAVRFVADGIGSWRVYARERTYLWGTFALGLELPHRWSGRLLVKRVGGAVDMVELTSARAGATSFLAPLAGSG